MPGVDVFQPIFGRSGALGRWILEVFSTSIKRWNPLERVSRRLSLTPTALLCALKEVVHGVTEKGGEVIGPLMDAGAPELTISTLSA